MHIEEMDMEVEWNEEMERIWFYQTKVGEIGIGEKFGAIVRVTFGRDMGGLPEEFDMTETPLLKLAAVEIQEYLDGRNPFPETGMAGTQKNPLWADSYLWGNCCRCGHPQRGKSHRSCQP